MPLRPYSVYFFLGHKYDCAEPAAFKTLKEATAYAKVNKRKYSFALINDGGDSVILLFGTKTIN